jgi:mannose-6-phosphate isomerase-like protein (cupin superfamily)
MDAINLVAKFGLFEEYWSPKIVGQLNSQLVKLAKLKGEFVWHAHEAEDELFLVVKGRLVIRLRDRDVILEEGELAIVPRGVEHKPVAAQEVHVLLFEPQSTRHAGSTPTEKAVGSQAWI